MVRDVASIISSLWTRQSSGLKLPGKNAGFRLWGITAAIALFAGATSFDYGRAVAVKADLEASAQAAAEAAASAICQSNEERAVLAVAAFNATYKWNALSAAALVPHVLIDNDKVVVTAKEQVETSLARLAGIEWMEVGAMGQAPSNNRLRPRTCLASAAEYLDALLALANERGRSRPADAAAPAAACAGDACEAIPSARQRDAEPTPRQRRRSRGRWH